jgi:rhodanese-related sulfurtransferase
MGLLNMLGFGVKSENLKDFMARGAAIIDVRTHEEFASGHIQGAKNIPLQVISGKIADIIKLNKPIIVCCRSGMRSAQAASVLKAQGIEVINGGGWESLQQKL